ncbi:VTC domain-containing protein [Prochlorococcus sp. MIT 1341]|uniref:VTC domain-containing protein n=1 Tax=Prochlorococcus sp. MIT 1341 TaxID=3096221 RepID=UPI002A765BBB|nr:VTC domain-containing protein [Prochlorococcus sp. MIT 1341]
MRYENKYELRSGYHKSIPTFLKCKSFTEIYPERIVNSLYYDDEQLNLYANSQNGISSRYKIRLRYYNLGESGYIVEKKVKEEDLNYKKVLTSEDSHFASLKPITSTYINLEIPNLIIPSTINIIYSPKVFVSYCRRYFLSPDKGLRITIDSRISFFHAKNTNKEIEIKKKRVLSQSILELKYDATYTPSIKFISSITSEFGLILSRSSKYCRGLSMHYSL